MKLVELIKKRMETDEVTSRLSFQRSKELRNFLADMFKKSRPELLALYKEACNSFVLNRPTLEQLKKGVDLALKNPSVQNRLLKVAAQDKIKKPQIDQIKYEIVSAGSGHLLTVDETVKVITYLMETMK